MNYNPQEFTLTTYQQLLTQAKAKFPFFKYTDYSSDAPFLLWRHDVDVSLDQALLMAQIEKQQGVAAIYFIHLHNAFYNALDKHSQALINAILEEGHSLGLHFDMDYYTISSKEELIYWLNFEKNILETLFKTTIPVFSFHNTSTYSMQFEDTQYAGMINTYSSYFKQIPYCSDSNGYWRFKKLQTVLEDTTIKQLQVLTHPEWWTHTPLTPRKKILSYVDKNCERIINTYDNLLKASGRENID